MTLLMIKQTRLVGEDYGALDVAPHQAHFSLCVSTQMTTISSHGQHNPEPRPIPTHLYLTASENRETFTSPPLHC